MKFSRFSALFLFLLLLPFTVSAELTVHFMNINRNDGILIECDGESAFLDAGIYEYGAQAIDYMHSVGVTKLKYYIGTHAHNDHVGAGGPIILEMHPDAVLQSHADVRRMISSTTQTDKEKKAVAAAKFITTKPGEVYTIGGASLTILGPITLRDNDKDHIYENENSLVCMLTLGSRSFLLTGDAPGTSLREIDAAFPGSLHCDVLKNPHHNGPLEDDVLALIRPDWVIYSTSDAAPPTSLALLAAARAGAVSLVTASKQNGTVVFHTDGESLTLEAAGNPKGAAFSKKSLDLYIGQKKPNRVQVNPADFKAVTYFSDDPAVAKVDENGNITARSVGSCTVYAIVGGTLRVNCSVTVHPTEAVLSRTSLTLNAGGTDTLRVSFMPKNASETVTWVSDDPKIASVKDGKVTAKKPGKTVIRAKLANGTEAACKVTVKAVPAKSVSLNPASLTLRAGESRKMTASVSPKNATDTSVTWSSADKRIATVSADGTVTGVSAGKTKITAKTANGKKNTINVTVKAK